MLHFNGKFRFQVPYFNNEPNNDATKKNAYDIQENNPKLTVNFDENSPQLSVQEVHQRLKCDPTKYFEFEFLNVTVNQITYDDGNIVIESDPIIGKSVLLKGLLVDLAPHLQRGRLFATEVRVSDVIMGKLNTVYNQKFTKVSI